MLLDILHDCTFNDNKPFEYSYSGTLPATSNVKDNLRQDTRRQIFFDEVPIRHLPTYNRNSEETIEILEQVVNFVQNYQ